MKKRKKERERERRKKIFLHVEHLGLASSNGTKINPASPVINKGVRDSSVDIRAQTTKGEQGIAVLSDKTRNRGTEKKMKRKEER